MTGNRDTTEMLQMIMGSLWLSRCLYVAAKLGIADVLTGGPMTAEDLARAAGAHAPSLSRVLRALASVGVFAEDESGCFGLTPKARLLASGPGSLRATAISLAEPWHLRVWDSFLHAVQTGENAWRHGTGQDLFDYFSTHPEHAQIFDDMMTEFSVIEGAAIADAYDFSAFHTVADIAGGNGFLLATLLERYPAMRGILFDLPRVTAGAGKYLTHNGIAARCEIMSGDMFHFVPGGADAYLLKNILHDWDDGAALRLLSNIRRAMGPQSRLLAMQEALPPGNAPSAGKLLDMQMLLIGGRERTEAEYEQLFREADLELIRIVPTSVPLHVIEAVPV